MNSIEHAPWKQDPPMFELLDENGYSVAEFESRSEAISAAETDDSIQVIQEVQMRVRTVWSVTAPDWSL